ncbi:MAG: histidine kinase [Bacteroidales bacterium]|nr:histidine kinase [Bacteroidales bacterium]
MLNPITKNKNYIFTYIAIWVLVTIIHTGILYYFYDIEFLICSIDAFISNGLFALFGFSLWYVIRFSLKDQQSIIDLISNHFFAAFVTIGLWLAIAFYSLKAFFLDQEVYIEFLNDSLPWRTATGIFFYLVFVLLYYLILNYEDLQEKIKKEVELKALVKEAELNALKSQINPHFLFNSLNSISSLTITDPDKAQKMLIKLSEFIRYSLKHDDIEQSSFKLELENIQKYLDIEKIRFGERLKYVQEIDENCLNFNIPNMLLQPLIENTIKHGVYNSTDEVLIKLECHSNNDQLNIKIVNDYDPLATKKTGHGIGLKNIRERLLLIYQKHNLLEINKGNMQFEVILHIPKVKSIKLKV